MDRPKPTKRQQEQWDKFVKDLPIYNPCPECRKLQSDLRKLVEKYKKFDHLFSGNWLASEIEKLLRGE